MQGVGDGTPSVPSAVDDANVEEVDGETRGLGSPTKKRVTITPMVES